MNHRTKNCQKNANKFPRLRITVRMWSRGNKHGDLNQVPGRAGDGVGWHHSPPSIRSETETGLPPIAVSLGVVRILPHPHGRLISSSHFADPDRQSSWASRTRFITSCSLRDAKAFLGMRADVKPLLSATSYQKPPYSSFVSSQ